MFDKISGIYDRLNRIISLGLDVGWRKKIIRMALDARPVAALDVATGTGDLAVALGASGVAVTAIDLSPMMIEQANVKIAKHGLQDSVKALVADCESLPFSEGSFDVATVAFGIRNFENLERGLLEIRRVLRPGGRFLILETSVPANPLVRLGYYAYCRAFLPLVGRLFSKDENAYSYLSRSAKVFPHGAALNEILEAQGFAKVENRPQSLGVVSIYRAEK